MIPTIDLREEKCSNSWNEKCSEVRKALEEYGCFLAIYDKLSEEMNTQLFDVVKQLFDLPRETKKRNKSDLKIHGYVGEMALAPLHESLGIQDATNVEAVQDFTNLMWPNSGNSQFCEAVLYYTKLASELEQMVDKMVLKSYGAEKHYEQHVKATTYVLRPVKYSSPEIIGSNVGSNIHTDKGYLTIIHQFQVNGLQIQSKNGQWISVEFPPSSFVVLAGDAFRAWSNGRIYSPRHQVLISGDKERFSLILFSLTKGIVEIPKEFVDEEHPLQFKPFDNFEMLKFYYKGLVDNMSATIAYAYCGINN